MKFETKKAIFQALTNGRHLSQLDCKEFHAEDMRTQVSHMKDDLLTAGYMVEKKWISTSTGRHIKEYWATKIN